MSADDLTPVSEEISEQTGEPTPEVEEPPVVVDENVEEKLQELGATANVEISPKDQQKLQRLIDQVKQIQDDKIRDAEYKKFWAANPNLRDLKAQLNEFQGLAREEETPKDQVEAQAGQPEGTGVVEPGVGEPLPFEETPEQIAQKAQELEKNVQENAQKGAIRGIQKEIKRILGEQIDPDQKEAQIREYLNKAHLNPTAVQEIIDAIANTEDDTKRQELVNSLVEKHIKEDPDTVAEISQELNEVKNLMKKIEGLGSDKTQVEEYQELYQSMMKSSGELLDEVPVEDFIDMVFATGHGYGGFRGGRYDKWKENTEDQKEKETLKTLGEVFDEDENPDGAKEFFAKLTDKSPEDVLADKSLLRDIESLLNSIESTQNPDEARKQVKKKMAEAFEAAGKKLEPEKINLSQDVLRYILIKAKELLKKQ